MQETMVGSRWSKCGRSIYLQCRKQCGLRVSSYHSSSLSTDALSSDGKTKLVKSKWDAIIVGGGHNGLTAAAYLARAGLKVVVLEKRAVLGGAAVTEEIIPGFKFSRCSYVQSLLRPTIIRELQLHKHGLKLLPRVPSSFTPTVDGKSLLLGADMEFNRSQISAFSRRDAAAYPRYTEQLERFCAIMDPILDTAPPEKGLGMGSWQGRVREGVATAQVVSGLLQRLALAGRSDTLAFMELLLAPASRVLDGWFENLIEAAQKKCGMSLPDFVEYLGFFPNQFQLDVLKATLATDAVIGAMASVKSPGTGYVLLHHVMGETDGAKGVWSYVEGGMGAVSKAIAGAAVKAGATLVTNAEVKQFKLKEASEVQGVTKAVAGVVLADGTEIYADHVLSNATPHVTFQKLLPADVLPSEFLSRIKTIDYKSGTTKINVAVDSLPLFSACNSSNNNPGPEHQGTIHLGAECMQELDDAYKDALNGQPSSRPLIELTIPSAVDSTIAPPGKHVINMFVQYTPYHLANGSWQDQEIREAFAKRCFSLVDEYAPGFSSSIVGYDMLTPPDLERIFGLTGGNIFHGEMSLDSLFLLRPVKGWSAYRTPLAGLFLCGSGAHPGGGVMGAPGRNAANVVLQDMRR